MMNYLRARWGEWTTYAGIGALAVGAGLCAASWWLGPDFADVGKPVLAAGLIAVLVPDPKARP